MSVITMNPSFSQALLVIFCGIACFKRNNNIKTAGGESNRILSTPLCSPYRSRKKEKAFERVHRGQLWKTLKSMEHNIDTIAAAQ